MRRRDHMEICLKNIIERCDSREFYKLLYELQNVNIMYGYAVAILMEFENGIYKNSSSQEIEKIIKMGESDRLFGEWIDEEL